MVTRERLKTRGLRAYEAGRLRAAARIAVVLVPAAALCLIEPGSRALCVCIASALLALAVALRWWDRRGVESVTTGLIAGSAPLAIGLAVDCAGLRCGLEGSSTLCTVLALLVGAGAGAFIASRIRGRDHYTRSLAAASLVAVLASSLGCARLGAVGLVAAVAGIVSGAVLSATVRRR